MYALQNLPCHLSYHALSFREQLFSFTAQVLPGCGAIPVALAILVPWAVFLGQAGSFCCGRGGWAMAAKNTVLLLTWMAILVAASLLKLFGMI